VLYGFETWSLTFREKYGQRVLVNRLLRKVYESKSEEVIRRRKLHSEEVYDYYFSSNIIWMISSWIMRWEGHVLWRREMHTVSWQANLKERDCFKDFSIDGRIILIRILQK